MMSQGEISQSVQCCVKYTLPFFYSVFGLPAIALWIIVGAPLGLFVLLLHLSLRRFGPLWTISLTPILWTGIEYFRSEIWYLKFAWILPGQAAAFLPGVRLQSLGVYGLGFLYVLSAAFILSPRRPLKITGFIASLIFAILMYLPPRPQTPADSPLHVAGVQLENPTVQAAADALDHLAADHPEAQLLVLSEYTFDDVVPQQIRDVIKKYHRYLIAGGTHWLDHGQFYDAAFVIGPDGNDLFEQDKSVPVQFMADGLPAPSRKVWNSPWGKIGIPTCYDISYARVCDDFIRQGAQALIVPTMDAKHWGQFERQMLHGRLAPIRSAEYGIPIFSVWSSGISQLTDPTGRLLATAPYPGQGATISGPLLLKEPSGLPPDRPLAIACALATACLILYFVQQSIRSMFCSRVQSPRTNLSTASAHIESPTQSEKAPESTPRKST